LLSAAEDVPELVAHLQENHEYCYAERDGPLLDRFNVGGSVAATLQLMRQSLERSLTRHASQEIAAEFPQHWFGQPFYLDIKSTTVRKARLLRLRRDDKSDAALLCDSDRLLPTLGWQTLSEAAVDLIRIDAELTFRAGQARPKTLGEVFDWLGGLETGVADRIRAAIVGCHPSPPAFFIIARNATIGVQCEILSAIWMKLSRTVSRAKFISQRAAKMPVKRLVGENMQPEFIYTRNMNTQPNLSGKHIALIGCGTIGSHLAKLLAQTGAGFGGGRLTLVDQQTLKAGNIGRHLLGISDVGKEKAVAVAELLRRLYPNLNISAVPEDVLGRLSSLSDYEVVIDATGDEGVANAINARVVDGRKAGISMPATIFIWLFGNGAAAQGLLVTSASDCCYRCLRPEHGKPWRFSPLLPTYDVQQVPAQCGEGPFFPYGVAAPATAAALALQLTLDLVRGSPSPRLRTVRLALNSTKLVKDQDPEKADGCPACGQG
jgi:molybdopterin/thiamine biosynthesis adenylyltransferase